MLLPLTVSTENPQWRSGRTAARREESGQCQQHPADEVAEGHPRGRQRPQQAGDGAGGQVAEALHRRQRPNADPRSAAGASAATAACSAVSTHPIATPAAANHGASARTLAPPVAKPAASAPRPCATTTPRACCQRRSGPPPATASTTRTRLRGCGSSRALSGSACACARLGSCWPSATRACVPAATARRCCAPAWLRSTPKWPSCKRSGPSWRGCWSGIRLPPATTRPRPAGGVRPPSSRRGGERRGLLLLWLPLPGVAVLVLRLPEPVVPGLDADAD
jgi:hypothetical protein